MHDRPRNDTPREYAGQDLTDAWRKLVLYALACIDLALDSSPREATAILSEAASELDGAIDELDGRSMAASAA